MTNVSTSDGWARGDDDGGSVLPLALGYALIALVVILLCVNATSLYIAQKQLDAVADSAALAGADGFEFVVDGGEVHAALDDVRVQAQASEIIEAVGRGTVLVAAGTPDGVSARVTVSARWQPPVLSVFVPEGVTLRATATSRTALD